MCVAHVQEEEEEFYRLYKQQYTAAVTNLMLRFVMGLCYVLVLRTTMLLDAAMLDRQTSCVAIFLRLHRL